MAINPTQPTPSNEPAPLSTETRTAILDAAEHLFAENGVDGTSVRDIARLANANLGAINYYFGSKDRLATEVFIRALEPANRRRLAWLDQLEKEANGKAIKLEKIMEVLIRPMLEYAGTDVKKSDAFRHLVSRCFHESRPDIKVLVKERFSTVCQRFDSVIGRALPELSVDELFWRTHFIIGAMHHAVAAWLRFDSFSLHSTSDCRQPQRLEAEELVQQLIVCATAAFRAHAPKAPLKKSETGSPTGQKPKSSHATH